MTSSQALQRHETVPRAARPRSPRVLCSVARRCRWERSASSRTAARPRQEAAAETCPRAVPVAREGRGANHLSMEVAR
eukprot:2759208-Alexandrium_andersonii.AAC.1